MSITKKRWNPKGNQTNLDHMSLLICQRGLVHVIRYPLLANHRFELNTRSKFDVVWAVAPHHTPQSPNVSWLLSKVDKGSGGSLLFLRVGAVAQFQELGEVIVVHGVGEEEEGGERLGI